MSYPLVTIETGVARKLNLFVLRHGEAGARLDPPEMDANRPLTPAGRREIAEVAEFLASLKIEFKVIAVSPLKRAHETGEIAARKMRMLNRLEVWDELKPTGDTSGLYRKLSRLGSRQQVLLVGHEPHLSGMIAEIITGKTGVNLVLKKGGLAKLRINGFKPTISGELRWLLTSKLMRKMV
jgi:phosphohistidine phosphatase